MIAGMNSGDVINDVWKTADLTNWTQVLANGHAKFTKRFGAAGVVEQVVVREMTLWIVKMEWSGMKQ